mmetsp:Transcript_36079/g.95517  ORF Transcript_36079/g.95517 Transcript_36079/m.95517 type:complete len:115 (+) Transcript_36079:1750-2094(+)
MLSSRPESMSTEIRGFNFDEGLTAGTTASRESTESSSEVCELHEFCEDLLRRPLGCGSPAEASSGLRLSHEDPAFGGAASCGCFGGRKGESVQVDMAGVIRGAASSPLKAEGAS